jgi:hypothetical protein
VAVSALPGATLQWHKNGAPITGATHSILSFSSIATSDAGTYRVVATNPLGSVTSDDATLTIGSPPVITEQPVSQSVTQKSNVTFTVAASGTPAPTFQWKKNGVVISGATSSSFTLKAVNKGDTGDYSVDVRNSIGWVTSQRAALVVANQGGKSLADGENPDSGSADSSINTTGLVNLSVRANAGTGNDGLIVGFVIEGATTKPVLVRGVGPTLRDFGLTGVVADPQLALYSGTTITASNDNWGANENAALIAGTSARVGAFSLASEAVDSALMATLNTGAYTVQLSGKDSTSGTALVEVYDAAATGMTKLVNLSVRAHIGTASEAPNVGFVIAGTSPRRVMIRAVGPSLATFGVTGAIADPQLELFRGATPIEQNDNWGGGSFLSTTFAQVGAFGFSDNASRDAVLLTTLEPGAYTVVITGVNGATGIGLVEVYDMP